MNLSTLEDDARKAVAWYKSRGTWVMTAIAMAVGFLLGKVM